MGLDSKSPAVGDMYRCEKCSLEIHVTKGCECDDQCAEFRCCGAEMANVTVLPNPGPAPGTSSDA